VNYLPDNGIEQSDLDHSANVCISALQQVVIDAGNSRKIAMAPEKADIYAQKIYAAQMNSPVSGSTFLFR
jgi:hypothetical protein